MRSSWLLFALLVQITTMTVPYHDCFLREESPSFYRAALVNGRGQPLRLHGGGLRRSSAPINLLSGEPVETGTATHTGAPPLSPPGIHPHYPSRPALPPASQPPYRLQPPWRARSGGLGPGLGRLRPGGGRSGGLAAAGRLPARGGAPHDERPRPRRRAGPARRAACRPRGPPVRSDAAAAGVGPGRRGGNARHACLGVAFTPVAASAAF